METYSSIIPNQWPTTTSPTETETVTVEECTYDKNGKLVKRTVTTTTKYRSRPAYYSTPTVWCSAQ